MTVDTQKIDQRSRDSVRAANRIPNAIFLKIAGGPFRAWSRLTHVGRRSGKEFVTPVTAFPLGDGFVMALLYGDAASVDWCLNVMAAGNCTLKTQGREHVLEKPEILPTSKAINAYPRFWRFLYRMQGIEEFLWVHRQSDIP